MTSRDEQNRHLAPEELDLLLESSSTLPRGRQDHLDGCGRCRREAEKLLALHESLSGLAYFDPAPGLGDRVMARVRLPQSRPRSLLSGRWSGWLAAAAAAALSIAAGGLWTWLLTRPDVAAGPVVHLVLEWAEARFWSAVVAVGKFLFDSGLAPAAREVVASLDLTTAAGGLAALSALAVVAAAGAVKLMQAPAPGWNSASGA